jgi:hypothetical protein
MFGIFSTEKALTRCVKSFLLKTDHDNKWSKELHPVRHCIVNTANYPAYSKLSRT